MRCLLESEAGQVALFRIGRIVETAHAAAMAVATSLTHKIRLEIIPLICDVSTAEEGVRYIPTVSKIEKQMRIRADPIVVAVLLPERVAGFDGSP